MEDSTPGEPLSREELQSKVVALEAENASLRAETEGKPKPKRFSFRALGSAVMIIVATVLVPFAIVSSWASVQLVSEDSFVATFAPLAEDPTVQAAIVEASMAAIEQQVDIDQVTDDLFDGLEQMNLPPKATNALNLLRAPAANGAKALMEDSVSRFVGSDLFLTSWRTALAYSHRALLVAAGAGGETRAVAVDSDGAISIELGPVVSALTGYLAQNGFPIVAALPDVNVSLVLASVDALALVDTVYVVATTLGWWIPIVCLGLFAGGIAVARRRRTAVVGVGVGAGIGAGVLLIGLSVGAVAVATFAKRAGVAGEAASAAYSVLIAGMWASSVAILLIAAAAVVLALATGSPTVCGGMNRLNTAIRQAFSTSEKPVARWRVWLRERSVVTQSLLLALVLLSVVLMPLRAWAVALIFTGGLLIWWVLTLLEAPADVD